MEVKVFKQKEEMLKQETFCQRFEIHNLKKVLQEKEDRQAIKDTLDWTATVIILII